MGCWHYPQYALDRSSECQASLPFISLLDGLVLKVACIMSARLVVITAVLSITYSVLRVVNFSMVVSGAAAVTYLLDTHGPEALHVLALSNFSKNIVLYGFTFFANGMIERRGVKVSLLILAGCQAFCWVVSVPMYLYGKRARSFVSYLTLLKEASTR